MIRLLLFLFGKSIRKRIAEGYARPQGFEGMEHAYCGFDGFEYYTWADLRDMPPIRQKEIERCLRLADAGIGEQTLEALCSAGEHAAMEASKAKGDQAEKMLVKVYHVFGEIRKRSKDVIPEEVYYDLAAIFVARRNEDPRTFDRVVHQQKVAMITEAGRAGHTFFLNPPAFSSLLGSLLTTEAAFSELLMRWESQRIRQRAVLEVYGKSLTPTPKPSMN